MRKVLPVAAAALLAALALPVIRSQGLAGAVRRARTDFVALEYLREAVTATAEHPLDRRRAKDSLERALRLAPDDPTILATAPAIYSAVGDYAAVVRALERQTAPNPLLLGEAVLRLGQELAGRQLLLTVAQEARQQYQAGRISEAEYAMQMNNVGYTLANCGVALDQARAMLLVATDILPLEANCVDSLGWVYYRLGEYRKAVFYLERAARLQAAPGQPEVLYHLGAAYARIGRPAQARRALQAALRLDPQNPEVQRELNDLRWLLPTPALATGARFPRAADARVLAMRRKPLPAWPQVR